MSLKVAVRKEPARHAQTSAAPKPTNGNLLRGTGALDAAFIAFGPVLAATGEMATTSSPPRQPQIDSKSLIRQTLLGQTQGVRRVESADEGRRKLLRYCVENGVYGAGKPLVRQICVDDTGLGVLIWTDIDAEAKSAAMITSLEKAGIDTAHAEAIAGTIYRSQKVEAHTVSVRQLQCKHGVSGTTYAVKRDDGGIGLKIGWRDDIESHMDRLPHCRRCFRAAGVEKGRVVQWLRKRDWKWLASMIVSLVSFFAGLFPR